MGRSIQRPAKALFQGLLLVVACTAFAADSPSQRFLEELKTLLIQKYINPNNIDLEQWFVKTNSALQEQCPEPCGLDQAERIIDKKVKEISDVHLVLYTQFSDDIKPVRVGSRARARRFGIQTVANSEKLVISNVEQNSVAWKLGLRKGQTITRINNETDTGENLNLKLSQAEARGQVLNLSVRHPDNTNNTIKIQAENAKLRQPGLDFVTPEIAVISIPNVMLDNVTDVLIHELIAQAKERGAKKMILDLRFDDGGLPFVTLKTSAAFLKSVSRSYKDKAGVTITYTVSDGVSRYETSKSPGEHTDIAFSGKFTTWALPVNVLVSGETISGLENLAGILQYHRRARVFGDETMGGGGVAANLFTLQNGTTVYVSTHRQFESDGTPAKLKIIPDVRVPLDVEKLSQGHDTQLEAAIKDFDK